MMRFWRWGRLLQLPGLALLLVTLLGACIWLLLPAGQAQSSGLRQAGLPAEGWQVCAELGIGQPPGAPGNVQLILLCTADGWEVRAYCTQPEIPAPAIGSFCSLVGESLFWCGDQVQQLSLYQIQQTPPPTATSTPTETPTPTATVTETPTATITPTAVVPPTETPTQTFPPAQVVTPSPGTPPPTETAPPEVVTPTPLGGPPPTATVYHRPPPGGPGNLVPVLSVLGLAVGLGLLAAAWFTAPRR